MKQVNKTYGNKLRRAGRPQQQRKDGFVGGDVEEAKSWQVGVQEEHRQCEKKNNRSQLGKR